MFYVVSSGCLELRRAEKVHVATSSRSPKRGRAHCGGDDDTEEFQECKMGILLEGSVFGSLPFAAPEPFTLVAITPCELWHINAQDFQKIPASLLQAIQDHLARSLTWRLARLQIDRASEIKRKERTHAKDDISTPLPHAAQNYGMLLMKNGKIHPHP